MESLEQDSPEIYLQIHENLTFNKGTKTISNKGVGLFSNSILLHHLSVYPVANAMLLTINANNIL